MKRRTKSCRSAVVCLAVLVLLAVWFVPVCFAVDAGEASSSINRAERDLGSAYAVVAEAEGAGVNVSLLLNKLGSAGDFLSEAYAAFGAGDYENANLLAAECSRAVGGVAGDAASLKAEAERVRSDSLFSTVAASGFSLVALLVLGFSGWRLLKRRYHERVPSMIPRVEGTR